MNLIDFPNLEKLNISYPQSKLFEQYSILLSEISNKKYLYKPQSGIHINSFWRRNPVVTFNPSFMIQMKSPGLEKLLQNPNQLIDKYSERLAQNYKIQMTPFEKKEISNKKIQQIMDKKGDAYISYMRKALKMLIQSDLKIEEYDLQEVITSPKLKIKKEKYRPLAEDFCFKFTQKFPEIPINIIN